MKYLKTFCKLFYGKESKEEEFFLAFLFFCGVPFLELIFHVFIVYFIPETYLVCNWKTVWIFFEDAGCANNTIGLWFYVIHYFVCIFFTFRMIRLEVFDFAKLTQQTNVKLICTSLSLFVFTYWWIYFWDSYDRSYRGPHPSFWISEFFWDFLLLQATYLINIFFFSLLLINLKRWFYGK